VVFVWVNLEEGRGVGDSTPLSSSRGYQNNQFKPQQSRQYNRDVRYKVAKTHRMPYFIGNVCIYTHRDILRNRLRVSKPNNILGSCLGHMHLDTSTYVHVKNVCTHKNNSALCQNSNFSGGLNRDTLLFFKRLSKQSI